MRVEGAEDSCRTFGSFRPGFPVPPLEYPSDGEAWTEAQSRSARRKRKRRGRRDATPNAIEGAGLGGSLPLARDAPKKVRGIDKSVQTGLTSRPAIQGLRVQGRSVPRIAQPRAERTVLIRCAESMGGTTPTYAEVMKRAREKISLEEIDIINLRLRRSQAGGILLEIPGSEEASVKAATLVDRFRSVLTDSGFNGGVSVVRPVRRAEIRITDFDDSVSAEEVVAAVASSGKASDKDVRVGPIRPGRGGLNSVWVQCPLACANELLRVGRIRLG